MSQAKDPQRPSLPFGNPFRMILPKGPYLSPKLLELLNKFEETLAEKLRKLKPADREDLQSLSWMKSSMEFLSEIHTDIKTFITALELPVNDWDDKWIDIYLDNSVKLLDISIAFSSELSHLKQGHLVLQFAIHNLKSASSKQFDRADSSLSEWRQHMASNNPKLDNSISIMDSLAKTLDLPKIKNSAKGSILMRAMYGVKVATLLICSIFLSLFSGSAKKLVDLQVAETYKWANAFIDLQTFANTGIRNMHKSGNLVVKELGAVEISVKKLDPILQDGVDPVEVPILQSLTEDLEKSAKKFSKGLDILAKEVDRLFQILMSGRNTLLSNLRISGNTPCHK